MKNTSNRLIAAALVIIVLLVFVSMNLWSNSMTAGLRCLEAIDQSDDKYGMCSQTIAVIDTGINRRQDKEYNIVDRFNSMDGSDDVIDDNGHGSVITGIICRDSGKLRNNIDDKFKIIVIKAADKDGVMTMDSLYKALCFLETKQVDVVNISLGGYIADKKVDNEFKALYNKNITILASSGDYGKKDLLFPASSKYVFSVGALDDNMSLMDITNVNDELDCAFPGENIDSVDNLDEKQATSGTSEATAIATSYVCRLKGSYLYYHKQAITNSQIEKIVDSMNLLDGDNIDFMKPFKSIAGMDMF